MKVRFLKVAKAEFDDAIEYYETQQEGLGNRFTSNVQEYYSAHSGIPRSILSVK